MVNMSTKHLGQKYNNRKGTTIIVREECDACTKYNMFTHCVSNACMLNGMRNK